MSGNSGSDQGMITIDIDAELERIIEQLDSLRSRIGAAALLKDALNSATATMRQQMIAKAKERYALKKSSVLSKESKVRRASNTRLEAALIAKGSMRDIMDFKTRKNSKNAAALAKVLRSSSMKPLDKSGLKAFVTTFASGHSAIVRRVDTGQEYTGSSRTSRQAKYGPGIDMTKIEKILAPSVPLMLGKDEVRELAEADAYEVLQAEIQRHIVRVLG